MIHQVNDIARWEDKIFDGILEPHTHMGGLVEATGGGWTVRVPDAAIVEDEHLISGKLFPLSSERKY
jgi:hypothetical protein